MEFVSRAVASKRVTCGMDLSDAGWPLLLAAGASLRACAVVDVAAAFARLCGEVRLEREGEGGMLLQCLARDSTCASALFLWMQKGRLVIGPRQLEQDALIRLAWASKSKLWHSNSTHLTPSNGVGLVNRFEQGWDGVRTNLTPLAFRCRIRHHLRC